jgi:hypothetical protein
MNGEIKMRKGLSERQMISMKNELLSELQDELNEELSKPVRKRDCDRITELTDMIYDISCGENENVSKSMKNSKTELLDKLDNTKKPNHICLYKRLSVVAACLLVAIGLNTASLKVFGYNMFSAAYQLSKGGITIKAVQTGDDNNIIMSESDPYGIKAKCAEYGFFPDTPYYIPEGFSLSFIAEDGGETFDEVDFYYKKGETKLNFFYTHYKDNTEIPPIGIPTDTYNITEEQLNGHTVYILKEDGQFTAIYVDRKIEYGIYAEGLDYDECQKILESLS